MLSSGSAFNAWKIASVATGSTADINDPNAKLKNRIKRLHGAAFWLKAYLGYVVIFFYLLSIKFVQTFPERNMHNPKAT